MLQVRKKCFCERTCILFSCCVDSRSSDEQASIKSNLSTSLSADELSADNYFRNAFYVFRALCKLSDRDMKEKGAADPK